MPSKVSSGLDVGIPTRLHHASFWICFDRQAIQNNTLRENSKLEMKTVIHHNSGKCARFYSGTYRRDRPSGAGLQGLASNCPERHWLKTVVVSVGVTSRP